MAKYNSQKNHFVLIEGMGLTLFGCSFKIDDLDKIRFEDQMNVDYVLIENTFGLLNP